MRKKQNNASLPIGLYCRVSGESQVRTGKSLENQEAMLRRYAEMKWPGRECIVYRDVGTGRRTGRKGYKAMMRAARTKYVGIVMATEISRMWRKLKDAMNEMARLQSYECDLIIYKLGLDTTTAVGKLQFAIYAALSEFESEQISERTKRAHAEIKSQGKKGPGRRPYGWMVAKNGLLKRHTEEQAWADYILAKRDKGDSWGAICDDLNEKHATTASGYDWQPGGMRLVMAAVVRRRGQEGTEQASTSIGTLAGVRDNL